MAVCEIWNVRGRLDHPIDYAVNPEKTKNMTAKSKYTSEELQALSDVIKYAANEKKTEKQYFVSGINCSPDSAREEMNIVKKQFTDESKIICYHGYQSFPDGEGSPEIVHEIGIRLAEKMWGDRFQVVVATHLNTNCLHNHFVVNSISIKDGMHYHDNKENLKKLRDLSDDICREYGLSVIKNRKEEKRHMLFTKQKRTVFPQEIQLQGRQLMKPFLWLLRLRTFIRYFPIWDIGSALIRIENTGPFRERDGNDLKDCISLVRITPMKEYWKGLRKTLTA